MANAAELAALRSEVEAFLYEEAELLDSWRLTEWAELFTEDAIYRAPALDDATRDPDDSIFLVNDDLPRIKSRARQLLGDTAWAENPRSQTRRLITNVRVIAAEGDTVRATANFLVQRCRMERIITYVGQYRYKLVRAGPRFKIAERIVILAQDTLRAQGVMSIIV
ncbi:MAG TPA: aromatic-ring-hydroxylating dioxygenase subunit beta [Stellaceae bacterium]|jgi:p-cumate 2,3-dioxygenase beta subunit|nr:aromatic-ring-hydroxylating dioxygenase subunit beta [Stellaceae bacterium]